MTALKRRPPALGAEGQNCELGGAHFSPTTTALRIQHLAQRFGLAPTRAATVAELAWVGGAA